jgi:serine protease Do
VAIAVVAALTAVMLGACASQPEGAVGTTGDTSREARVPGDVRRQIALARDRVFPALVHIDVVTVDNFGGRKVKQRASGSGTIIDAEGHVLTNAHVIDKATTIWCTLSDKRRIPGTLVGDDPFTDLAVVKIDAAALAKLGPEAVATFGNSDKLHVGDYVIAMGSPFSLSRTVTLGVVSNMERVFTRGLGDGEVDEITLDAGGEQRTGLFTNWIQHDALINPGNSGGPLVNLGGEVIGVNTRGGASMGFATPSNLVRQVADSLIKQGGVARSWAGVTFRHIQDTGIEEGVLIDSVDTEGPGAKAGLRPGDVVLSLDGTPTTVRFVDQIPPLLKRIADYPVGTTVEVTYRRNGATATCELVTERLPKERGDEAALRAWGLTVKEITERVAKALKLTDTRGVLVGSVRPGSAATAAEPSIEAGDIIRSIDGEKTPALKELVAFYERTLAMENPPPPENVLIEFDREGKNYLTLVKSKPDKPPDRPREVAKAWIGIETQPLVPRMVEKMGPPMEPGFRVTRVYTGTTAQAAGLEVGDVIVSLNGEKLRPRGIQDSGLFARLVRNLAIDSTVELTVLRKGERVPLEVTLERYRLTNEDAQRDRNTDFELTVRELTFFDREDNRWAEEVAGVMVEDVERAGWAGLGGVAPGDLIQRIDGIAVRSLEDYRRVMSEISAKKPKRVVFVVLRRTRTYFRFVEPEWGALVEKSGAGAAAGEKDGEKKGGERDGEGSAGATPNKGDNR